MVTDEFSFPIVVTDNHNVTVSPSLWRISSVVDHSSHHQCGNGNINNYIHDRKWFRKSFSSSAELEKEMKRESTCTTSVEKEIKMDMLWEECFFNECHVESDSSSPVSGGRSEAAVANYEGDDHKVELWNCVEALNTSKTGMESSETGMGMPSSSKKKPGVVGVLKVLKKLFIPRKKNRRPHRTCSAPMVQMQ